MPEKIHRPSFFITAVGMLGGVAVAVFTFYLMSYNREQTLAPARPQVAIEYSGNTISAETKDQPATFEYDYRVTNYGKGNAIISSFEVSFGEDSRDPYEYGVDTV